LRALEAENILKGQSWTADMIDSAGRKAAEEARPISDVRASAEYRRQMVDVLTRRAVLEARSMAGKRRR